MSLRSESIQKWWPATQSLDLIEAPAAEAAAAVETELRRILSPRKITASWEDYPNLDAAFQAVPNFTIFPTHFLVLPTHSRWSVFWSNSFLCDGYDSLCWNLTTTHRLTTLQWSAHDEWTTFQTGARFVHRRWSGSSVLERSVCVAQEDSRWHFFASGEPLPGEDLTAYNAKRKRDRLNESLMAQFLGRFGAFPWSEEFYMLSDQPCFVVRRTDAPASDRRSFSELGQARFKSSPTGK